MNKEEMQELLAEEQERKEKMDEKKDIINECLDEFRSIGFDLEMCKLCLNGLTPYETENLPYSVSDKLYTMANTYKTTFQRLIEELDSYFLIAGKPYGFSELYLTCKINECEETQAET